MSRVSLQVCVAALSMGLSAGACGKSEPAGPTPTPSTLRVVVVRDGSQIGVVTVPPGKPAELTLEGEGERAASLKKLIDEINTRETFHVRMHLPKKEGERGPYGARLFRRSDADYTEGVRMKLLDEGYDVKDIK